MKRTWNLAPVLQIVQKILENYCPCLYLSTDQVWWLKWAVVQNIYSQMHPVSCTNNHHEVTDLVNHGMIKNTKTWLSSEGKINLNLCLRWHILRSYHFVVEVTFKSYYWEKPTFSKLRFSKFKKFISRSVSGELQLTQISLNF